MSGYVLRAITADDRVHLIFQLEFNLLQPVFLHFLLGGEVQLGFERLQLLMITGMLLGQPPDLRTWLAAAFSSMAALVIGLGFYARFRHRIAYWL